MQQTSSVFQWLICSMTAMVFTLASGCHKSVSEPECGYVEGFTKRDVNGVLIPPADTSDWKQVDDWCPAVEALFADLSPVIYATADADSLLPVCFPNPAVSQFILGFYRDDSSRVDIRFVDADHQLLFSLDSMMVSATMIQANDIAPADGRLVRAYYRVTHPDGTGHRGHGDVQLGY